MKAPGKKLIVVIEIISFCYSLSFMIKEALFKFLPALITQSRWRIIQILNVFFHVGHNAIYATAMPKPHCMSHLVDGNFFQSFPPKPFIDVI